MMRFTRSTAHVPPDRRPRIYCGASALLHHGRRQLHGLVIETPEAQARTAAAPQHISRSALSAEHHPACINHYRLSGHGPALVTRQE